MLLAKLEISGFKSFYNKTTFEFFTGINGIVGPNGCGKSNVIDSVRWVMGEQNVKYLRGQNTEDVIFNGSQNKKPLNLAEVSITFHNNEGDCPPEYANYPEIVLQRRIFRSGEKEYFINKTPCRLKDITAFFQSAGLGTRSYAIIAQGQVDQIVQAKPEEIRQMIEDAAGISIYRSRIKDTNRLLEETTTNLSRVNDIIVEKETQCSSLKNQVGKARRYHKLVEEKRELELSLLCNSFAQVIEQRKTLELQLGQMSQSFTELQQVITNLEIQEQQLLVQIDPCEKLMQEVAAKGFQLDERIKGSQSKIDFLLEQKRQAEGRQSGGGGSLEELQIEITQNENQIEQLKIQLKNETSYLEEEQGTIEQNLEEAEVYSGQITQHSQIVTNGRKRLIQLVEQVTQTREKLAYVKSKLSSFDDDQEKYIQQIETLDLQLIDLEAKQQEIDASYNSHLQVLKTVREKQQSIVLEQSEQQKILDELNHEEQSLRQKLASLQAKRSTLENMSKANPVKHSTINWSEATLGRVADYVKPAPHLSPELINVLDKTLTSIFQSVIVQSVGDLQSLLEKLLPQSSSRIGIVCLDTLDAYTQKNQSSSKSSSNSTTPVSKFLEFSGDIGQSLQQYFDQIYFTNDLAALLQNNHSSESSFPSQGFLWIDSHGVSLNNQLIVQLGSESTSNTLGMQTEIRKTTDDIEQVELQLLSLQEEKSVYGSKIDQLKQAIIDMKDPIQKAETEAQEARQQQMMQKVRVDSLHQDKKNEENRKKVHADQLQTLKDKEIELLSTLNQTEDARQKLDAEIEKSSMMMDGFKDELQRIEETLSVHRVRQASLKERVSSKAHEIKQLDKLLNTQRQQLSDRQNDIIKASDLITDIEKQTSSLREDIMNWITERESNTDEFMRQKELHQELKLQQSLLDQQIKAQKKGMEQEKGKSNDIQLQLSGIHLTLNHIDEKTKESFQQSIGDIYQDHLSETFNEAALKEEVANTLRKIDQLGPVNLLAIQDYDQMMEKLTFLQEQKADIETSMNTLRKAMADTTKNAKDRFMEVFDQVNYHFQQLFPILFPTGEGRLEVMDAENVLESGVDITAKLPGKKQQSKSLFSGGEKALTAISLIFALLKTKPTSFCFLDEVDAALDEANVERYNNMIRELSKQFQFVVITHNKRTVETANGLFGITMQEPGVTKVVSVELSN